MKLAPQLDLSFFLGFYFSSYYYKICCCFDLNEMFQNKNLSPGPTTDIQIRFQRSLCLFWLAEESHVATCLLQQITTTIQSDSFGSPQSQKNNIYRKYSCKKTLQSDRFLICSLFWWSHLLTLPASWIKIKSWKNHGKWDSEVGWWKRQKGGKEQERHALVSQDRYSDSK